MRSFLRCLFRKPAADQAKLRRKSFAGSSRMSSSATAAALYAATISPASITGAVPEEAKELRHHLKDGKGFDNPWESWRNMAGPKIGWAMVRRRMSGQAKTVNTDPPTVPVRKPAFLPSRSVSQLRTTWLGHACHLVEFPGGFRVLFDPVFEERCSPFSWLGPKRYTEMPCSLEDIPIIDAVIISHSHYDHLSHPTILKIKQLHPNVHFFVPLRIKQWFIESGIKEEQVTELDWWEEREINLSESKPVVKGIANGNTAGDASSSPSQTQSPIAAKIGCLPCQHTSGRTLFDKAHTLWASWSVTSGGKSVWFGGDTGYRAVPELPKDVDDYSPEHKYPHCPAFKQIGDLRGPFDLGLIPIGAYDPRWIMSPMHANPFDSVNIFLDTRCRQAIGIHWGTWVLTEEDVLEPPKLLKTALARKNIPEDGVFDVCDIGECREFGRKESQ